MSRACECRCEMRIAIKIKCWSADVAEELIWLAGSAVTPQSGDFLRIVVNFDALIRPVNFLFEKRGVYCRPQWAVKSNQNKMHKSNRGGTTLYRAGPASSDLLIIFHFVPRTVSLY